jgi:hypothetical protein
MKNLIFIFFFLLILTTGSCKKDDSRSCTTCDSPQTTTFVVCEEGDGNASVNGENTGTPYDQYVTALEAAGANCSG